MDNPGSILAHFGVLIDPRVERTREHKLVDILVIALSAVIPACAGTSLWRGALH